MRGVTSIIVQTHQILRLACKVTLIIDPCHTCNAIYNARNNKCYCPNSPNTAPATQNDCHDTVMTDPRYIWNAIYNARNNRWHPPTSPNIVPATPNDSPKFQKHFSKQMKRQFQCATDPRPFREWSEHNPSMKPSLRNPPRNRGYFSRPPRAFCIEKYNISRSGYHSKFHRILRLPRKVTLQLHQILRLLRKMNLMIDPFHTWNALFTMRGPTSVIVQTHQILRLPRKMKLMIDQHDIWNAIYNARNNRWHPPTSPNTAPATQNDCHDWSSSHMKRYLQCAEQQVASSNITKYCACHAKWLSNISKKFPENSWNVIANAGPIRAGPDHDPRMKPSSATRLATEVTFQDHHEHFVLKNTTFRAPAIIPNFTEYCACHEKWHFNFTKYCACHEKWISWLILFTHETRYLQCAEQQVSLSKLTKYCACHAKWNSWLISMTYETLFTMRGTTGGILQHHQILRLPREMTLQHFKEISRKQLKRHFQCGADPSWIRPWSENETVIRNPPRNRGYFSGPPRAFCIKRYNISRSGYHSKFHRILRLPRKVTLQLHRILRLLRKMTVMILSWLILVTYATLFTMRGTTGGILQHHQILRLPRKMTLQHFKEISRKQLKRHFQCGADPRMIRATFEQETVRGKPSLLFRTTTSILYWKIQHFVLRLSFQISPNTAPATKSDTSTSPNTAPATQNDCHDIVMTDPRHIWNAIYNARNNRWHPPTSPNTAPATQNDCHDWSSSHMKRYEMLFTMHGTTGGILQHHQILRLPRKMTLQNSREISRKQLKRHFQCGADPSWIQAGSELDPSWIRPWSENETVTPHPASQPRLLFSRPPQAFCIEKYNISRSGYHSKFHQILRLPRKVTLQLHQILRLPRKVTLQRHQIMHLPRKVTLERHQIVHLPRKVTLERHQIDESNLLRISCQTNLIFYESLLKRI